MENTKIYYINYNNLFLIKTGIINIGKLKDYRKCDSNTEERKLQENYPKMIANEINDDDDYVNFLLLKQ